MTHPTASDKESGRQRAARSLEIESVHERLASTRATLLEVEEALEQRRRLLSLALGASGIVLWQQDSRFRYRWIYNSQLGYQDGDVVGKRDLDLLEDRDEAVQLEALKRTVLEQGVRRREDVRISRGGRALYYDLTIEPLFDQDGRVAGITCASIDITGRKEAEAERERFLARLTELNETLEAQVEERTEQVRALSRRLTRAEQEERQRIAEVLHGDVQQMLYALQIQHDLLRGVVPAEALPQIDELSAFVNEIVEGVRSLSVELSPPAVANERLDEMLVELGQLMGEQHRLQVAVAVETPCIVADRSTRELLWRALRELLFNVVKHSGVAQARLEGRATAGEVVVAVVDDGVGFDAEATLRAKAEGQSFGLQSVQERIQLFGGTVAIESAPGAGTRTTITLPNS